MSDSFEFEAFRVVFGGKTAADRAADLRRSNTAARRKTVRSYTDERVLEVATGTGRFAGPNAKPDPAAVREAKRRGYTAVELARVAAGEDVVTVVDEEWARPRPRGTGNYRSGR